MNIHNFKYVNKVFSYEEGDVILKNYACTIKNMLYENEIVARLGGDNFVLLVNRDRYEYMVENIQNIHIYHSAGAEEKQFSFGATIGASGLENIRTSREVMARASVAYQTARLKGVGRVVFYSDEIQQRLMENQSIISDFGTGFSSLNMIKSIDLNIIKIDKLFIPLENDYNNKDRDKIMFSNIINMVK